MLPIIKTAAAEIDPEPEGGHRLGMAAKVKTPAAPYYEAAGGCQGPQASGTGRSRLATGRPGGGL